MNIIIKKPTPPPWRLLQPRLGHFRSLHKDGKTMEPTAKVEKQFSREELEKIANACRYTAAMGNPSLCDEDISELQKAGNINVPPTIGR